MERVLSLLAAAALAATLTAALIADSGSRACLGGGSRGLRGRWLPRHRLWRLVPSWFLSWPTLLFGPRLFLRPTLLYRLRLLLSWPTLFGLRRLLNWPTLLYRLRLFLSWPPLFGLRPLLNWPLMLFGLRLLLSWLTLFGLRLLVGRPMLFDLWRFLVHRRSRLLSPGRWHVVIGLRGN